MAAQYYLVNVAGSDALGNGFNRQYATLQNDARTALSAVYAHEVASFPLDVGIQDMSVQPFGGTIL
jgi:hypothetical protein